MEGSLLTEFFLHLVLAIIMLGMGLSLTLADFKRIMQYPKAMIIGLLNQLVLLPLVGFLLMAYWDMKPEYAVGLILLAACPGGATSNLLAYLGKGDGALSISLTAFSSLITIFTIPFIVNYGMKLHLGKEQYVPLPVLQTILQVMVITVIPVAIGMAIKSKREKLADKAERPVKIASAVLIVVIILGVVLKNKDIILPAFKTVGLAALLLNLITLFLGILTSKMVGLSFKQASTISIESGIQNGTLAISIAMGATLLNNPEIAIPPAVYSIIMFVTGGVAVFIFGKKNAKG